MSCMYDPYEQCFRDCPNCPRAHLDDDYEDIFDYDEQREAYEERYRGD